MRGADRMILLVLPLLALAVGFWVLVLAPKSREASDLQDQVATLQATIDSSEAEIAIAEKARAAFPTNYADLVALGTAVPEQDEQSTLIQGFSQLAAGDAISFRSFKVVPGTGAAPQASAPVSPDPAAPSATAPATQNASAPASVVPATEASAAGLPIGATVGPAGLPVTPYSLTYNGGFFDMADLFAGLDGKVEINEKTGKPVVHGRLLTIDGFSLAEDPINGFPDVTANLAVTTYLVPPDQGIGAGATPAGPAPVGSPDAPALTGAEVAAGPAPSAAVTP